MNLRHIRPRSVDWYDATLEDGKRAPETLSPEEKTRLRQVAEAEQQVSLAAIEESTLGRQGPFRLL